MKRFYFSLPFANILLFSGCTKKAASIGIIGGADGPTAVFVTGAPKLSAIIGALVLFVLAIVGIFAFISSRKK